MSSWDDLARAKEEGLEIASHTLTHRPVIFKSGRRARYEEEIFGSKQMLEAKLGAPCRYIAWPYGRIREGDRFALSCLELAGYEACFSGFRERIEPGKTNPYAVPRHQIEAHWPLAHVGFFARGGWEGGRPRFFE